MGTSSTVGALPRPCASKASPSASRPGIEAATGIESCFVASRLSSGFLRGLRSRYSITASEARKSKKVTEFVLPSRLLSAGTRLAFRQSGKGAAQDRETLLALATLTQLLQIQLRIPAFLGSHQLVPGDLAAGVHRHAAQHGGQRRLHARGRLIVERARHDAADK